jgi:hypothetical protein
MNTVGLFAGRGDVVLAMGLAFVIGAFIGWKLRGFIGVFAKRK